MTDNELLADTIRNYLESGVDLLLSYDDYRTIIKALEQGLVLDKISAEIEEQKNCVSLNDDDLFWYRDGLNDAIEIIYKYRQER